VARNVLAAALVALTTAGCGASSAQIEHPPATTAASRFAGAELSPPRRAPALSLHDAHGRTFTLAGQRGHYALVTFIYTHCPDVCPLITSNLNTALRILGPRADVRVLAVSVDPKGDTPASVRAYERRMRLVPAFHYLIGTRAQLMRTWAAWSVAAVARKPDLVDHIAYTALVDPAGRERVLYDSEVRAQQVVHDIRVLLGKK
jgi:protein SCO1/2